MKSVAIFVLTLLLLQAVTGSRKRSHSSSGSGFSLLLPSDPYSENELYKLDEEMGPKRVTKSIATIPDDAPFSVSSIFYFGVSTVSFLGDVLLFVPLFIYNHGDTVLSVFELLLKIPLWFVGMSWAAPIVVRTSLVIIVVALVSYNMPREWIASAWEKTSAYAIDTYPKIRPSLNATYEYVRTFALFQYLPSYEGLERYITLVYDAFVYAYHAYKLYASIPEVANDAYSFVKQMIFEFMQPLQGGDGKFNATLYHFNATYTGTPIGDALPPHLMGGCYKPNPDGKTFYHSTDCADDVDPSSNAIDFDGKTFYHSTDSADDVDPSSKAIDWDFLRGIPSKAPSYRSNEHPLTNPENTLQSKD